RCLARFLLFPPPSSREDSSLPFHFVSNLLRASGSRKEHRIISWEKRRGLRLLHLRCFCLFFVRGRGMASGSFRNGGPKLTSKLDRQPSYAAYSTPKPASKSRPSAAPASRRGGSVAPAAAHSTSKAGGDAGVPGRVRVAVRLRPRNAEEMIADADFADCVELQPEVLDIFIFLLVVSPIILFYAGMQLKRLKLRKNNWDSETYEFDEVLTEFASQKRVYEVVAKPVVEKREKKKKKEEEKNTSCVALNRFPCAVRRPLSVRGLPATGQYLQNRSLVVDFGRWRSIEGEKGKKKKKRKRRKKKKREEERRRPFPTSSSPARRPRPYEEKDRGDIASFFPFF
ncbi:hypothetical protein BHM03_00010345, partial [Ensete ventricosum]